MAASNQTQIPVLQHPDPVVNQLQQNVNKVLRNTSNKPSAILTNWAQYPLALVGFGAYTNLQAFWRRVGDSMEVQGLCIAGASPSGTPAVPLPAGYIVDNSNSKISNTAYTIVGSVMQDRQAFTVFTIIIGGANILSFGYFSSSATGSTPQDVVIPSSTMSWRATFPINGWSWNS